MVGEAVDQLVRWFADTRDVHSRLSAWGDGWQVVRDFPVAGTGINTYPDAMLFYQKHVLDVWMTHALTPGRGLLALGEGTAIRALEREEDQVLQDYRNGIKGVDPEVRAFLEANVLPEEESTHRTMSDLKARLAS